MASQSGVAVYNIGEPELNQPAFGQCSEIREKQIIPRGFLEETELSARIPRGNKFLPRATYNF